jgi:uncharacterized protein YjeT (DUF2065 family)
MDPLSQVLLVAGLVLILEALPYFGFPELLQRAAVRLAEVPTRKLRRGGFIMLVLGLLLLFVRRLVFF